MACSSDPEAKPDRICTPGNYVFCRCEDRREGTKLCRADGVSFDKCDCGSPGKPPPLSPDGDSRFVPVDASAPPDASVSIDGRCAGKLAVLASGAEDIYLYAGAYTGNGVWAVAKSQGTALRSPPRAALVDQALVTIWQTRFELVAWTKFQANQTTLSPPFSVGFARTTQTPTIAGNPTSASLYYRAEEDVLKEGAYSPANGWDNADTVVPSDGGVVGKSAPAAAVTPTGNVIAFSGADGTLATQTFASGAWSAATPIAGAKVLVPQPPALVALDGGAEDALVVYTGSDLVLHSSARAASGQTWSAPIIVDTLAIVDDVPSLAPLSGGRAMLVWKSTNGTPYYSIYDAAKNPPWSAPAGLLSQGNPTILKAPTVAPGHCASEATAAYVAADGNVYVALFANGKWTAYLVPGMTKMTFAGAGEVP